MPRLRPFLRRHDPDQVRRSERLQLPLSPLPRTPVVNRQDSSAPIRPIRDVRRQFRARYRSGMSVRRAVASTAIVGVFGSPGIPSLGGYDTPLPGGIVHAYEHGAETSVCGVDLDDLYIWPDYDFSVLAHPNRCESCQEQLD